MKYLSLSSQDAKKYIIAVRANTEISLDTLVKQKGDGEALNEDFIDQLRRKLGELRSQMPTLLRKGDESGPIFEARATEVVHRLVPSDIALLADAEFWIWLAIVHFQDLIEWRYGSKPEGCDLANYGIGASSENFIFRLWLRAELSLDDKAQDRYHLSRRGDIDFWRSHLFRQGYASVRTFSRALIRFQYPENEHGRPKLKIAAIRELVKRLRRLRENLFLELLDDDACIRVIEGEAQVVNLTIAE